MGRIVGAAKSIGKTLVLLLLIIIMVLAGLLWFDYFGVIQMKKVFAPVYRMMGLEPQNSESADKTETLVLADLDDDRLEKRLEALEIRVQELDKRESDISVKEAQNEQIAQELDDRRAALEESEKTFNNEKKKTEDREVNIRTKAEQLNSMPPKNAVSILLQMDDQDLIDTIRMCDRIAEENGESSQVSYWMSQMPAERAAEIYRKMTAKPQELN